MQIIRGGILSRFSWISLQLRMFFSENFLSYYKVFLGFKMADSGPGSGPGLLRYVFQTVQEGFLLNTASYPTGPLSKNVDSTAIEEANKLRQHINLLDYLAHFYIQVARQGWVSNYLDRHGNLECN